MRYGLFAALIATAVLSTGVPASAAGLGDGISAAELKTICTDTKGDPKLCSAYIAGFSQGFYYAAISTKVGYAPCLPRGVKAEQARLIVTKFMGLHDEMMQQGAPSVVAAAFIDAFPCGNLR